MPNRGASSLSVPPKNRVIARLPDIAILTMVAVIGISMLIIQRADLAVLLLLPLLFFLGFAWYQERKKSKAASSTRYYPASVVQANLEPENPT